MKGLLFFLILGLSLVSCKSKKLNDSPTLPGSSKSVDPPKFSIYCWCFSDNREMNGKVELKLCTTWATVRPDEIIKETNLKMSINEKEKLEELRRILFSSDPVADRLAENVDSRLVFVLKRDNEALDTFVYYSDSVVSYNNRYFIRYSFNILDTIEHKLGIHHLICEVN